MLDAKPSQRTSGRRRQESVRLQAAALKSSAEDTARALQIAQESSDAAKASAEALQAQAYHTRQALETAQRSAEAAERLAEANEALAIAGQRGWLIVFKAHGAPDHALEPSEGHNSRSVLAPGDSSAAESYLDQQTVLP